MTATTLSKAKSSIRVGKAAKIYKDDKQTQSIFLRAGRQSLHRGSPLQANILRDQEFLRFLEALTNLSKGDLIGLTDVELAIISDIHSEVAHYISSFNYLIRVFVAQSTWEIGQEVHQSFESNKNLFSSFQEFLEGFLHFFERETGILDVGYVLQVLKDFACELPERQLAFYVAFYSNWSHLQEIIKVPGTERKVFYATLAAEKNLPGSELKQKIIDNEYEKDTKNKEQTIQLIRNMQPSGQGKMEPLIIDGKKINAFANDAIEEISRKLYAAINMPLFQLLQ